MLHASASASSIATAATSPLSLAADPSPRSRTAAVRSLARLLRRLAPTAPLLAAAPLSAATLTWNGGAATSLWSDAANWSSNTLPTSTDTAAFTGAPSTTVSLGDDRSLAALSFSGDSAYTLSGHSLTLSATTGTINAASPSTGSLTHTLATTVSLSGATSEIATASGATLALTGGLSASGAFTKSGSGTLVLSGSTNAFSSGATVTAGTLQLGTGAATGSATGNIAISSGATLAFNRSDAFDYTDIISGAGSVTQSGASTLRIKSAQTFTGPLTIATGNFAIGFGTGSVATQSIVNHATLI
jgi:fibronectin-binding autotransporter adhesin